MSELSHPYRYRVTKKRLWIYLEMQVTVLHFMKEELHLMTYIASISQRRNILEARCIVLLPEDRILAVEPDSFAIYGIPPLQPMVPTGHAGADGVKPCAIAVGP